MTVTAPLLCFMLGNARVGTFSEIRRRYNTSKRYILEVFSYKRLQKTVKSFDGKR